MSKFSPEEIKNLLQGADLKGAQVFINNEGFTQYFGTTETCKTVEKGDKPNCLATPEAESIFAKLISGGILDAEGQPRRDMTQPQCACVVELFASRIELPSKWQTFADFWGMDAHALRSSAAKGVDSKPTRDFNQRMLKLF